MDKQRVCQVLNDWPESLQGTKHLYNIATGCYCALGWLGHVGGMTDEELLDGENPYERVGELYGLTYEERQNIWVNNDSYHGAFKTPQEAVLTALGCV